MISSEKIIGTKLIHFDRLDSTNSEAKRLIEQDKPTDGIVITAAHQTQGRGQFGKTWISEAHQNIMMSAIISPTFVSVVNQFDLNIFSSLAVYNVVSSHCSDVSIKWPNDIYIGDQKVCGILIQNFLQGNRINHTIIGIGLNVLQRIWSEKLPNPTSLALKAKKQFDLQQLTLEICDELDRIYKQLQFNRKALHSNYEQNLYRLNVVSHFVIEKSGEQGIIRGINSEGKLLVEIESRLNSYNHGEISFII